MKGLLTGSPKLTTAAFITDPIKDLGERAAPHLWGHTGGAGVPEVEAFPFSPFAAAGRAGLWAGVSMLRLFKRLCK